MNNTNGKSKSSQVNIAFKIRSEQLSVIKILNDWRSSQQECDESLDWAGDLAKIFESELNSPRRIDTDVLIEFKIAISLDLAKKMGASNRFCVAAGYHLDRHTRAQKYIDALIERYSKQLEKELGKPMPKDLNRYLVSILCRRRNQIKKCAPLGKEQSGVEDFSK